MLKSKPKIEVVEVEDAGLIALLDQHVLVIGVNYHYAGKLIGVNTDCIELENCYLVFETGAYNAKEWKLAEKLPGDSRLIMKRAIESIGLSGK